MSDEKPKHRDSFHASVKGSGSATNHVVNGNHVNSYHWLRIVLEVIGILALLYLLCTSPAHGFINV